MLSSYPTLIPSSISVGATWSPKSTTNLANCLTFIIYLGSSESAFIIFVHLATCNGCSPDNENKIFHKIVNVNGFTACKMLSYIQK